MPFTVRRESVGFLFNRIWHATRRECLMVVAEGVSTSEEVSCIWRLSTGTALGPLRDGIPAAPRELLRDYVDKGFLGVKSGRGFYDYGD